MSDDTLAVLGAHVDEGKLKGHVDDHTHPRPDLHGNVWLKDEYGHEPRHHD